MARASQDSRDGWIKNPNPSRLEVSLYTVLYISVVMLSLPLILAAFVIVRVNDGFWMGDGFFKGYYYSCLYGRH